MSASLPSTYPLDSAETEEAINLLRSGLAAIIQGGRVGFAYKFQDGQFIGREHDEGDVKEWPVTEEEIREAVVLHPGAFHRVLLTPRWDRFADAFFADDRPLA